MMLKTETSLELRALDTIEEIAKERVTPEIINETQEVRAALETGRFNVAVVGQFKRGKSTLITAIIGRELLPADVAPLTSAITMLQCG